VGGDEEGGGREDPFDGLISNLAQIVSSYPGKQG
jgi:hypothetical protein